METELWILMFFPGLQFAMWYSWIAARHSSHIIHTTMGITDTVPWAVWLGFDVQKIKNNNSIFNLKYFQFLMEKTHLG
jgi:hypothetical protein